MKQIYVRKRYMRIFSHHQGKRFGDIHESIKTRIIREGVETTAIHEATEWDTPKCGKSVCLNEGRNGVPKGRERGEGRGREITSTAPAVPRIYDSFGGALRMITHAYWTGRRGVGLCSVSQSTVVQLVVTIAVGNQRGLLRGLGRR